MMFQLDDEQPQSLQRGIEGTYVETPVNFRDFISIEVKEQYVDSNPVQNTFNVPNHVLEQSVIDYEILDILRDFQMDDSNVCARINLLLENGNILRYDAVDQLKIHNSSFRILTQNVEGENLTVRDFLINERSPIIGRRPNIKTTTNPKRNLGQFLFGEKAYILAFETELLNGFKRVNHFSTYMKTIIYTPTERSVDFILHSKLSDETKQACISSMENLSAHKKMSILSQI